MTKAVSKAVASHDARLKASGGAKINLKLPPAANAVLMAYCTQHNVTRTKAITQAVLKLNEGNENG